MDIKFKIEKDVGKLYLKDFSLYSTFLVPTDFSKRLATFQKAEILADELKKDDWYNLSDIIEIPKVNIEGCYYLLPYFINAYITEELYFENPWYMQAYRKSKNDPIDIYITKMPTNRIYEYRVIYDKLKNKVELA